MFAIKIFFWPYFKGNVASHYTLLEQAVCLLFIGGEKQLSVVFVQCYRKWLLKGKEFMRDAFILNAKIKISSSTAYHLLRSVIRNSAYTFSCCGWEIASDCDVIMYGFMQDAGTQILNILSRWKMEIHGYSAAWVCRRGSWGTMTILKFRGN